MKTTKMTMRLAGAMVLLAANMTAFALTVKNPSISVEQMTKQADEIIIGHVLSEEPAVIGRTFETRYKVQISESLKTETGELVPGKTVTMTLPGAALTTPPITQYVSGVPYMAKGEEVLLFLRNSTAPAAAQTQSTARSGEPVSGLSASPKIVGWDQGRFSVLTHPSSGKKLVTRINMENYGLMNSGRDMRKVLDAVAAEQLPLVEKAFVRMEDKAAEVRTKDPLELTPGDTNQIKVEEALQKGAAIGIMRQRGGIPVQSLEDFKNQVKAFAAQ